VVNDKLRISAIPIGKEPAERVAAESLGCSSAEPQDRGEQGSEPAKRATAGLLIGIYANGLVDRFCASCHPLRGLKLLFLVEHYGRHEVEILSGRLRLCRLIPLA
jgi:hypothetical protein